MTELEDRYRVVEGIKGDPGGTFGVVCREDSGVDAILAIYRTRHGAEQYRRRLIDKGIAFHGPSAKDVRPILEAGS